MTLIVEDGTGLSTADSYISLARAIALIREMGLAESTWVSLQPYQQEASCRQATSFLDGKYVWRGTVLVGTQALGWPRRGVEDDQGRRIDADIVPLAVERAAAFLVVQTVSDRLDIVTTGAPIVRRKVDVIETEWASGGTTGARRFPEVDTLLTGLYDGMGQGSSWGNVELLRA